MYFIKDLNQIIIHNYTKGSNILQGNIPRNYEVSLK